jgi:hypothetical protein
MESLWKDEWKNKETVLPWKSRIRLLPPNNNLRDELLVEHAMNQPGYVSCGFHPPVISSNIPDDRLALVPDEVQEGRHWTRITVRDPKYNDLLVVLDDYATGPYC